MRTKLLVLHRWLAIVTALPMILIALSGAMIVSENWVADTNTVHVTPGPSPLSLDSLARLAVASMHGGRVTAVELGRAPDQAYGFSVAHDTAEQDLLLDPYTGRALGPPPDPTALQNVVRAIHRFHTSLLAGSSGKAVVAFVTLSALLLVLVGLVLWWRDKPWRIHWSASWKRIVFDLHHALGVFAALVLLIITLTGVWMGYSKQVDPLVLSLNRSASPTGRPRLTRPDSGATTISLDSILQLAHSAVPDAPVLLVQMPPLDPTVVWLRYAEDHTPGGRSRVFIDPYRGRVLQATNTRTMEAGTKLMSLQRPLHTGDIFGTGSRFVWCLAAIILASQAITGILMWWNGRAARRVKGGIY